MADDICIKIHIDRGHRLLAACDKELLGNEYKEGDLRLKVGERFYNDDLVDGETLLRFLNTVTTANLVGERVVNAAVKAGYIDEDCILKVDGIPHAQMFTIQRGDA